MKRIRKIFSMILACYFVMADLSVAARAEDAYLDDVNNSSAVSFQNHTYQLFDGICSTWQNAEEYCESLGGHLATITSQEENDFLYSYITGQGIQSAYFGFTDEVEEGVWTWVTGESVSYTNWNESEPNQENPNEDYAMFYYKYTDGTWNDGDFDDSTVNSGGTAFICEWDESIDDSDSAGTKHTFEELMQEYVEQHINYYQTSYSDDIVPMRSTSGLGYALDDIDDDLSVAMYKGLSVAAETYSTASSLLKLSSYVDIDIGDFTFSFTVPQATMTTIAHSEYDAVLYQLMASDTIYNGILEAFSINYEKNVKSFIGKIAGKLTDVAKDDVKNDKAVMDSLQKDMIQISETIGNPGVTGAEFEQAFEQFESLSNQYMDLEKTKDYLEGLITAKEAGFTFLDVTFDEINSIGAAYQYTCWAESYAQTSIAFKEVLTALRDAAYQKAWSGRDTFVAYSQENMNYGLYTAIDSFVATMESYAENTHKEYVHQIVDASGDTCAELIADTLRDEIKAKLGGTAFPELSAINTALSTGKLLVDLFTDVDDEYKYALAVGSLETISSLLVSVSNQYGNDLVSLSKSDSYLPLNEGSIAQFTPVTTEVLLPCAIRFDESIKLYKNALLLACDYGKGYEEIKKQTSDTSTAITLLTFQKNEFRNIHCHDESLTASENAGLGAEPLRLTEIREYGEDGTRQSVTDLAYDENGNLITEEIHYLYEPGEASSAIINNSFDEKGRLLLREYEDGTLPFPIAEYRYDESDRLIYEATDEGSLLYNEYAYDENGQITAESESDGDTYTTVYDNHIYDDNGCLIRKSGVRTYITDDTEYLTVEYGYDEEGRPILIREQCDADTGSYELTFEYAYHNAGPLEIVYCLDSIVGESAVARIPDAEGHAVAEYALYDELTFSDSGYLIRSSDGSGAYKQYIYEAVRTP